MAEVKMPEKTEPTLPGNSFKSRERVTRTRPDDKKSPSKIVKGKVLKKKKPFGEKLRESLFGDVPDIKEYLLWDIFIPAAKNTLYDLIVNGAKMKLFKDKGPSSNIRREGGTSYVKYRGYNSGYNSNVGSNNLYRKHSTYRFDDIILERRDEAESVLEELVGYTIQYGCASVADLYSLIGIESSFTDNGYGWDDLSTTAVVRVRDGYLIDLPKPQRID